MDVYERSKFADAVKEKKVKKDEVIIKKDEKGDVFYILLEGEAVATLDDDNEPVMTYKQGDYFGELALLRGEPRAANVIATCDSKLIYLDRESFSRLLGPLDQILKRNISNYMNYMTPAIL
jgi:cAMP-dependent protein kinase regulator